MHNTLELTEYSDQEIFNKIIIPLFEKYSEARWLADDNVAITRESPSGDKGPGWTTWLIENKLLTVPTPACDQVIKYIELERMLSSVVFFHLFFDGSKLAYSKLTAIQKGYERLSEENYQIIHQLMRKVAHNETSFNAMVAMLVYSDLGKAPQARLKATKIDQDFNINFADHDDFIDAVLNLPAPTVPHIIPSYFTLSNETKIFISNISSTMKIHLGHVLHVEGGIKMFQKFMAAVNSKRVSSEVLNFAFAIQIADVAASAGHVTNQGSLSFTDATCRGYLLVKTQLDKIKEGREPDIVLKEYLQERASWINLTIQSEQEIILSRLACMLRNYHVDDGRQLLKYSENLSTTEWGLLTKQFALDAGFNNWERNPTYIPAVLLNLVKLGGNPVEAAVCLAHLLEKYEKTGLSISSLNPLCFNNLAGLALSEPQLFTPAKFDSSLFDFDEENNVIKLEEVILENQLIAQ